MTDREHYKKKIRDELRAWEGDGPPGQPELANHAIHELNGLLDDIDELRDTDLGDYQSDIVEWIEGDALKALVGLEMWKGSDGPELGIGSGKNGEVYPCPQCRLHANVRFLSGDGYRYHCDSCDITFSKSELESGETDVR